MRIKVLGYSFKKRGQRTLTLNGSAKDASGKSCSVVLNATISHYW